MQDRYTSGSTYFISGRTFGDLHVFNSSALCTQMIQNMKQYRSKKYIGKNGLCEHYGVCVLGYCILPTQYFVILKQVSRGGITYFLKNIRTMTRLYYKALFKYQGKVFETSSISAEILTREELAKALSYIHRVPLRTDIVQDVTDMTEYPWTSYEEIMNRQSDVCDIHELTKMMGGVNIKM